MLRALSDDLADDKRNTEAENERERAKSGKSFYFQCLFHMSQN